MSSQFLCLKRERIDFNCSSFFYRLHAWGDDLKEAFEQCAMAMFGYMTEIDKVSIVETQEIEAQAEDMLSLLFHFLDEFLYVFSAEPFFIARVSLPSIIIIKKINKNML
jgi:SHS2 domain-containing protein